ncbi:MAG: alpha-1,6-mannosyltransferase [Flavobacteriaceae bacterium]|jgi:alpha-1,6-mannosyltransferase
MSPSKIWRLGIVVVFIISIFLVNWESDRTNFGFIATLYTLAFICYLLIIRERGAFKFKHLIAITGLAHLVSMFYEPNLSNDYYRFLWDGEMAWNGINVFDFKPNELVEKEFMKREYMQEIYTGMADLSKRNYSCYPPANQLYFIISTSLTSSVAVNVFIMKLIIVLTEVAGAVYLRKLFIHFKVNPSRIWVLFLNPLLIIECTGNVHFEGVMLSLLVIAFYFLFVRNTITAATIFGLAIQIKLVPLLLLPFFFRFFGWKKAMLFCCVTGAVVIVLGLTQINSSNALHFFESLALYFRAFEFNSFIFYNYLAVGKLFVVYNPIRIIGPILSCGTMLAIVIYALWKKPLNWQQLFNRLLFGFFIFLMMGSTLHPWYVLPLLTLSLFTNYTFPILWSFLIFFSYFFYSVGNGSSFDVRLMVSIEYVLLFGYVIYEIRKKGSPFKFLSISSYFQPNSET